MIRVQVANQSGTLIAELTPMIGPISWRLNDIGRVQFWMGVNDEKATSTILRYGNRVYIDFDNGLPAWGGIIDPPREWEQSKIKVTAYSAEYIFGQRQTSKLLQFKDAFVGEIFTQIINDANAVEDMGISLGSVWSGAYYIPPSIGDSIPNIIEYHYANLLKIIQGDICGRLSSGDFAVIPSSSGGRVYFSADLYEQRGMDKSGKVKLLEGHNIGSVSMIEQGKIINWWDCAGSGTGWSDDRLTANTWDSESRSIYGLRQDSKIFTDVDDENTLNANAENLLAGSVNPHNMFDITALDMAPAEFGSYDVGDIIGVELYSYGFGGTQSAVRVISREFNPDTGDCKLVVEEQ